VAWNWADLRSSAGAEARRLLRDPNDVDDAVQEAMVRAWRQRGACRSPDAPERWLRQIARNEAFRHHHRAAAHPTEPLPPEDIQGDDAADQSLLERLCVDDALRRLSRDERRLVLMRYKLDLPDPAIARSFGIAESTVRVRLHRLKEKLRVLMGDLR
jgi:RNA polymerase sigma-70 factor, ECF subfamily